MLYSSLLTVFIFAQGLYRPRADRLVDPDGSLMRRFVPVVGSTDPATRVDIAALCRDAISQHAMSRGTISQLYRKIQYAVLSEVAVSLIVLCTFKIIKGD